VTPKRPRARFFQPAAAPRVKAACQKLRRDGFSIDREAPPFYSGNCDCNWRSHFFVNEI
jgi:hypothetical protein